MGSRDKDKAIQAKLVNIFKRKPNVGYSGRNEFTLSQELIRDISKESQLNIRLKTLKDLSLTVEHENLADNVVEKLWSCTEDLFAKENPTEARHMIFSFTQSLVKGRMEKDKLGIMRAQYFRLIKHHDHPEDIGQRLDLLITLTADGRIVKFFEEEIGKFMLNWFPDISQAGRIEEYLNMLDNIIHYNAAYLDESIIIDFIHHICLLCQPTTQDSTIKSCLKVLSSIVAFSNMSPQCLPTFIGSLCQTVVREKHSRDSWPIMKNLLGTHLGHSAIYTMCNLLQESSLKDHVDILRASVFFIRMGLWTIGPLQNLKCPPSSILPYFLLALKGNHASVALEVGYALQQLVCHYEQYLLDSSWSTILKIMSRILSISNSSKDQLILKPQIKPVINEIMNSIENYIEKGLYNGNLESYYLLVEEFAADRPTESILKLIKHRSLSILPTHHLWMTNLYNLLHKYFKKEPRTEIRLKVLENLMNVYVIFKGQYEDELIERIIVPHMTSVVTDRDAVVRAAVVKMLVEMCRMCESKRCLELLDVLEKFLFSPFEHPQADSNYQDVICLVDGLTKILNIKIITYPSSHAVKIYQMFVAFLEKHYEMPLVFQSCNKIRYTIFDCFLKMRADSYYHLGYPDGDRVRFSPYLCVVYRSSLINTPPPQSPAITPQPNCVITYISLRRAFKVILTCLRLEKDYEVLNLVLNGITKGLENKSLVIGKGNNELDLLVNVLCSMVSDRSINLPDSLNVKISKPDFHTTISLVLVNLASYHSYLDNNSQQKMIRCIMKCIQSAPKNSQPCISALTICTLEMRDVMVKILPEVLLNLSKMSPTQHIAVPVLEFLSTMTQQPTIFANFVADQYMSVIAVALFYTNPFKYNHYIVSLAHHVIAVWFLKCRINFRKDFVSFIIKGLQASIQSFEDKFLSRQDLSSLNQDSSDRKRSSSLTEQGSRRREERTMGGRMEKGAIKRFHIPNKGTFYEELNETCIDLMARYAYSPCSALPKRLPGAEFLLNGGQSVTWLVGNKLVTVTTSGCTQKVLKQGLCDKCWSMCNTKNDSRLIPTGSGSTEPSRQNSNEKSSNSVSSPHEEGGRVGEELVTTKLQEMFQTEDIKGERYSCACWCQGWAEIYIRRPTGNMSWAMRIQNDINYTHANYEFPLNEISTLYMPSLYEEPQRPVLVRQDTFDENQSTHEDDKASGQASPKQTPSRQSSQDKPDDENDEIIYEDGTRSRNPVRRSNSSPEMSAGWKNPFLKMGSSSGSSESDSIDDKKGKMYSKDMRVSCEAIPEEIADAAPPPTSVGSSNHPSLLSYHSYPGSSLPSDTTISSKPYQTVPPSPAVRTSSGQQDFTKRPTNLPTMTALQPLSCKPPQSPTQTSPRMSRHSTGSRGGQELQKSTSSSTVLDRNSHLNQARERAKERKNSGSTERLAAIDTSQPIWGRDRVHTISVMRSEPVRHPNRSKEIPRSGVNPSFVFLQLYHTSCFNENNKVERPLLIGSTDAISRSVKILDNIPPYETHTIGVLYIGKGQVNNEIEILRNSFGSLRYTQFIDNLGSLVKISDVDPQVFYLGGLDHTGADGKFVYIWQDDIVRVTFHIATLMPSKDSDPNCIDKKRHIGNDCVNIVYNESGEEFDLNTIKSQFNFACIIIHPLDHNVNRVIVKIKSDLQDLDVVGNEAKVVSDQNLATYVRQTALHHNLASLVAKSLKHNSNPYASNWLERLRQIKRIRNKVLDELQAREQESDFPTEESKSRQQIYEDFTNYS
ncbi:TSC complex subunit tuberin isoform X2 [Rhynchophorus ferrugineus]|uniref:TSC complex subunit tuberin isoform X2 n=1 Tax=Rhynchophorus ferrugineus TaxID=354439 RepID=UPI003FCD6E2A